MSGSHEYYYTSTSSRHPRTIPGEEDSDKTPSQGLPHLRDVLRGELTSAACTMTLIFVNRKLCRTIRESPDSEP